MVKSVVPFDSLQHLEVTTYQPITSLINHLHKDINREKPLFFAEICVYVQVKLTSLIEFHYVIFFWGLSFTFCLSQQWSRYQRILLSAALSCGTHWNFNSVRWMLYHLNVRVLWASGAPLPGTALLFAVFIELGVPENGHAWTLVLKRNKKKKTPVWLT